MSTYREIFRREQAKLPKDATPQARGEATKRAADIYRGRARETRSNPILQGSPVKLAVYGAIAYIIYKNFVKSGPVGV